MPHKFILLLLICLSVKSFAQKNPLGVPGTVMINDRVSMKATEVSLQEWMGFIINNHLDPSLFPDTNNISSSAKVLFEDLKKGKDFLFLKIKDNPSYRKQSGDKAVISSVNFKMLTKTGGDYFSMDLPVTGISFKQAILFCKWKEAAINASQEKKIRISLPSVETYAVVISNKDSLCKGKCDSCQQYTLNCISAKCVAQKVKRKGDELQGISVVPVNAYWPTSLGLFNLQGNAAEMTDTEGIAMGGSFKHFARDSYSDRNQKYTKSEDWLGFRYIVSVN